MPKPITDTDRIYLKELLTKVIKHSGIQLSSTTGYHQLQKQIQHATNEILSISTLKRLFGSSSTKPTQVVLDICAKFTGFSSWQHYLTDARQFDKYLLHHEVSSVIINQKINIKNIQSICSNYGHLKDIQNFLFTITRLAAEQNNIEFFEIVFTLPNIFNKKYHNEYDLYYLGQVIALTMRSNPQIAKSVAKVYCQNPKAIKYCIEYFVDEDYLNGYYGYWLQEYIKHKKTTESLIFYNTLLYKRAYQKNNKKQVDFYYKKLKTIPINKPIFKIVEARYCAIMLIQEQHLPNIKTSHIYNRIIKTAKKASADYIDFQFYLLRYLFMAKKHEWLCNIVNLFDNHPVAVSEHWTIKNQNGLLLYQAFVYHLQNQNIKAQEAFNQINIQLFDPFIYNCMMNDYNTIKAELTI